MQATKKKKNAFETSRKISMKIGIKRAWGPLHFPIKSQTWMSVPHFSYFIFFIPLVLLLLCGTIPKRVLTPTIEGGNPSCKWCKKSTSLFLWFFFSFLYFSNDATFTEWHKEDLPKHDPANASRDECPGTRWCFVWRGLDHSKEQVALSDGHWYSINNSLVGVSLPAAC